MALHCSVMLLLGRLADAARPTDLSDYVLTTTGSVGGGNTFPGVSEPFGMVKLGPDLHTGSDSYSGYQPSGRFLGFSMLHMSGTGGAPKYGVVAQMPVLGAVENPLDDHRTERERPDESEVGYYRAFLSTGITVELAAASRAGMYRYTFPSGPGSSAGNVVVDVSHVLPSFRGMGLGQHFLGGSIEVESVGSSGEVWYKGHGSYDNGWNRSPEWTVYFCGTFDRPAKHKTFLAADTEGNSLAQYPAGQRVASSRGRLGAVFTFDNTTAPATVTSRVGVSFISEEQACRNLEEQVPRGTELRALRNQTRQAWNSRVLSRVATTDTNVTMLQHLYTSLYFMHLTPVNKTGENPKWTSAEPYYDDIFTLWDLFRCTTSLLHVLQPTMYEDFVRSLIDTWRHEGWMPDARSSFFNGATQGGSNADTVLADAFVKGVRGLVDWDAGFAAMVKDAEVQPPNNGDPRDPSSSTKEGRGALPDWIRLGYVSTKYARSVTRAVEYAGNDFGLYQVARGLERAGEAEKYLLRSRQWRSHWNPSMSALGFAGFLGPRKEDGSMVNQDPLSCNGCYWGDHYYQGLPWEYTFNAHHDMDTLIELCGGAEAFARRLEMTFQPGARPDGDARFNKTIFNPGNEPSFTTPYLFNFVGRQDLSVKASRHIGMSYYSPTPGGLPGNSDAGAMESWILWAMIGLYPLAGQTTFLVGSPWLANLTLTLGAGKELRISALNGSATSFYVQSLAVNGRPWSKSWVTWDDVFANGGTMDFVLGPMPSSWGRDAPPPPSPASESYTGQGKGATPPGVLGGGGAGAPPHWLIPTVVALAGLAGLALTVRVAVPWLRKRRRRELRSAIPAALSSADRDVESMPMMAASPTAFAASPTPSSPTTSSAPSLDSSPGRSCAPTQEPQKRT